MLSKSRLNWPADQVLAVPGLARCEVERAAW